MKRRSANDQVPSLIAISRVATPDRRLNRFCRYTKGFTRIKLSVCRPFSVRITQLKPESQYAITKIQEIRRETGCEFLRAFRNDAVSPYHPARQPSCQQTPARLRLDKVS